MSPNIFLVEDEEHLVSLYQHALQSLGSVVTANTADEAVEKLATSPLPDVILLDLLIPENPTMAVDYSDRMGFHVLEHIRSSETLKDTPVLVMTNLDASEDRKRADELGAVEYIVKSNVVPRQIIKSIEAAL